MKKRIAITIKYVAITFLLGLIVASIVFYRNYYKTEYVKTPIHKSNLDISYGSDNAPIKIFLFMDYSCVHCRNFMVNIFPKLKNEYIDKELVQFNVKIITFANSFQLQNAYKTLLCLNQHGNFEELNMLLLQELEVVFSTEFNELVEDYIDRNSFFADCLLTGESEDYLNRNLGLFFSNQFSSTPTFVVNDKIYKGFMEFEEMQKIIDKELVKD